MAIYHLSAKVIKRSAGRNVVHAAAYRAGERLVDSHHGETFDYTNKKGVIETQIHAPRGAPDWVFDREALWSSVEAVERRRDAQLARELQLALPHELDHANRRALVELFVNEHFVSRGMIVDVAYHAPSREGDARNFHAHLLLSLRTLNEDGTWSNKVREWNRKAFVEKWRAAWADTMNDGLERWGAPMRVDHRSFARRGLELEPTEHLGPAATAFLRRGRATRRADQLQETLERNRTRILDRLTEQRSCFRDWHIDKVLKFYEMDPSETKQRWIAEGLVEPLVAADTGKSTGWYTTPLVREKEQGIIDMAAQMNAQRKHRHVRLANRTVRWQAPRPFPLNETTPEIEHGKAPDAFTFGEDQLEAGRLVFSEGGAKFLQGDAGTGKTTLLKALHDEAKNAGYRVFGVAPTNVVVQGMRDAGIDQALTVHKFIKTGWRTQAVRLTPKSLVLVDEASMISTPLFHDVLKRAHDARAKIVFVGDKHQLDAIERGGMFEACLNRFEHAQLHTIIRQNEAWMRDASQALAEGRIKDGVRIYDDHGHLNFAEDRDLAIDDLVHKWGEDAEQWPLGARMVLAYTNDDVSELNQQLRDKAVELGEVAAYGKTLRNHRGEYLTLGQGDRVVFRETFPGTPLNSGTFATVQAFDHLNQTFTLEIAPGKTVRATREQCKSLDYAYAATTHLAQGRTVDRAYVLYHPAMGKRASYVGFTRHRDGLDVFVSQDDVPTPDALTQSVARETGQRVSLDVGRVERDEGIAREPSEHAKDRVSRYREASEQVKQRVARFREPSEHVKQRVERYRNDREKVAHKQRLDNLRREESARERDDDERTDRGPTRGYERGRDR